MAILSLLLPIILGGSSGAVLSFLSNPIANRAAKLGIKVLIGMAKGNHLSEEDRIFIKKYNAERRTQYHQVSDIYHN